MLLFIFFRFSWFFFYTGWNLYVLPARQGWLATVRSKHIVHVSNHGKCSTKAEYNRRELVDTNWIRIFIRAHNQPRPIVWTPHWMNILHFYMHWMNSSTKSFSLLSQHRLFVANKMKWNKINGLGMNWTVVRNCARLANTERNRTYLYLYLRYRSLYVDTGCCLCDVTLLLASHTTAPSHWNSMRVHITQQLCTQTNETHRNVNTNKWNNASETIDWITLLELWNINLWI